MPTPSTSILANGTLLKIATGTGGAKNVTGMALGNPTIITSAAHGFNNGDFVNFAALTGNTSLNGLGFIVKNKTTNTFAVDFDTTGGSAWVSGGTATPVAFTTIGNANTFTALDGAVPEVDITNFLSPAKEFRPGLYDGGTLALDVDLDNADAGQLAARAAMQSAVLKQFQLVFPAGATPTLTFTAFVKKFTALGAVDGKLKGAIDVRVTGAYSFA